MNENKLQELDRSLFVYGFDSRRIKPMRAQIAQKSHAFQLEQKSIMDLDEVYVSLHFKKPSKADGTYFNHYRMTVLSVEGPSKNISRDFEIDPGNTFTLREAYNLLKGRPVCKYVLNEKGALHKPWLAMDFTGKPDSTGNLPIRELRAEGEYDLRAELLNYPIRNLKYIDFRDALVKSLERGNLHHVAFQLKGKDEIVILSADPVGLRLNISSHKTMELFPAELFRIPVARPAEVIRPAGESDNYSQADNAHENGIDKNKLRR